MAAWLPIISVALSLFLFIFILYPKFEDHIHEIWKEHLSSCQRILHKLYWEVRPLQLKLFIILPPIFSASFGYYISRGFGWITVFMTGLLGFAGWVLPRFILSVLWSRRMRLFDQQLIDALNLMANSLKSGLNLPQALQVLVTEMPDPISQEFGQVLSQKKLGLSLDDALEKMIARVPSKDLSVAIHSILILRETGGDLSETFDVIANTIRERRKVDGKVESLTAQGKMQGLILFLMPFGFGLFLYINNPDYLAPMFQTTLGWMIIILALMLQTIGLLWVRKIVKIEV